MNGILSLIDFTSLLVYNNEKYELLFMKGKSYDIK